MQTKGTKLRLKVLLFFFFAFSNKSHGLDTSGLNSTCFACHEFCVQLTWTSPHKIQGVGECSPTCKCTTDLHGYFMWGQEYANRFDFPLPNDTGLAGVYAPHLPWEQFTTIYFGLKYALPIGPQNVSIYAIADLEKPTTPFPAEVFIGSGPSSVPYYPGEQQFKLPIVVAEVDPTFPRYRRLTYEVTDPLMVEKPSPQRRKQLSTKVSGIDKDEFYMVVAHTSASTIDISIQTMPVVDSSSIDRSLKRVYTICEVNETAGTAQVSLEIATESYPSHNLKMTLTWPQHVTLKTEPHWWKMDNTYGDYKAWKVTESGIYFEVDTLYNVPHYGTKLTVQTERAAKVNIKVTSDRESSGVVTKDMLARQSVCFLRQNCEISGNGDHLLYACYKGDAAYIGVYSEKTRSIQVYPSMEFELIGFSANGEIFGVSLHEQRKVKLHEGSYVQVTEEKWNLIKTDFHVAKRFYFHDMQPFQFAFETTGRQVLVNSTGVMDLLTDKMFIKWPSQKTGDIA